MTGDQRLGLWANIPRLRARRFLEAIGVEGRPMSSDALYDLTLAATGSKLEAEEAAMERMKSELRSGATPM